MSGTGTKTKRVEETKPEERTQPEKRTFPGWPQVSGEEIDAAVRVLESGKINYWTGDEGRKFEEEYAAFVGSKHAIALTNGTVALELALYAIGIGEGDDVVTTSRTFIASASCATNARVRGKRASEV